MGNTTSAYDESGHHSAGAYANGSGSGRASLAANSTVASSHSTMNEAARKTRAQTIGMNINNSGNLGRQRRASSVVGSLLNGGMRGSPFSRSFDFNHSGSPGEISRKKNTKERQLAKEAHYRNLVVKFDECVDGGYLAPYGVHDDEKKLDYNDAIVRQLIVDRKLQPFYLPLEDYEEDELSDADLIKILNSTLLHQPYPTTLEKFENLPGVNDLSKEELDDSFSIDSYIDPSLSKNEKKIKRSLIYAARLYKRKSIWQQEENDRFLDAKAGGLAFSMVPSHHLLLDLYRNGDECPICFLYYPKNFNFSRCCQQPICSECFVQIKRKDPHYKNSHDDSSADVDEDTSDALVSECACCPYCATPDFGVTYEAPILAKRSGLGAGTYPFDYRKSQDIKPSSDHVAVRARPRTHSLPANHQSVVTSDMIRSDWEANLSKAKMRLKKRFAKANTIHMNNRLISSEEEKKIKKLEDQMLQKAIQLSLASEKK